MHSNNTPNGNYVLYLRTSENNILRTTIPKIVLDACINEKLNSLDIYEWKLKYVYNTDSDQIDPVRAATTQNVYGVEMISDIYPTTLVLNEKDLFKLVLKYGSVDNFMGSIVPKGSFKQTLLTVHRLLKCSG